MSRDCARCGMDMGTVEAESSLYSPSQTFIICEPCFFWEEDLIEETGTNEHPEVVATYTVRASWG